MWKVDRSATGVIHHLEKTRQFVNHYSFHIIDPTWGHVTIKISGHPPFGAQVILNGHEYVACGARSAGIGFTKEGNCFTQVSDPERLAQIADTFSQPGSIGRLSQVIDRWIYTACLCYGLGIDEQQQSGFRYDYSIYQVEYSRNLRVRLRRGDGPPVQHDGRPHPLPARRTEGPHAVRQQRPSASPRQRALASTSGRDRETSVEPDHLQGPLRTVDAEGVHQRRTRPALRGDRASHQAARLRPHAGQFAQITTRLTGMVDRFTSMLDCVELGFLPDSILDRCPHPPSSPQPGSAGSTSTYPGFVPRSPRALALAVAPAGFTVAEFTTKVRAMTGQTPDDYSVRQGAYDLRKLRGKQLVIKPGRTRRYHVPDIAARTITALLTLRDKVIAPLIAGIRTPRQGRPPKNWTTIDRDYEMSCPGIDGDFVTRISVLEEGSPCLMPRPRKYPQELIDRGVRLALESGRPIAHVAAEIGLPAETLRKRVRQAEADQGLRPGLPT